jgi:hypothetical protein
MNSPGKHAWQIRAADEQHTPEINSPVGINSEQNSKCRVSRQYSEQLARQAVISVTTRTTIRAATFLWAHDNLQTTSTTAISRNLVTVVAHWKHRFRLAAQYLPTASVNNFLIEKIKPI